jgi:NUMOD4 motif
MDANKIEIWMDVPGFEGAYRICNDGNLLSLPRIVERRNGAPYSHHGGMMHFKKVRNSEVVVLKRPQHKKCFTKFKLLCMAFGYSQAKKILKEV